MAKKNSKHGKSNQTKPQSQSSKMSVTMEEEKTSETVVEETYIGTKKLKRHQEKIKREEEELKRIQAEKHKKEEAAERSKKASKNKAPKSKNKEKELPILNMTEHIPVVKNTEIVEKPLEQPMECVTPPIKTSFVKPGSEKEWVDPYPNTNDWNEIIKNEEEPITDDEKMQQQTGSGNLDMECSDPTVPHAEYQSEVNNQSLHDRGTGYRGSDRKNQNQKSFGRAEFRRGGRGGNYYHESARRGSDYSNRGENSNFTNQYNVPRTSNPTSYDSQNLEGNSNARPSSRPYRDDRSQSNETGNSKKNSNSRQQHSFSRGSRQFNRSLKESGIVDKFTKSNVTDKPGYKHGSSSEEDKYNDGSTYAPRPKSQNDNRGNHHEFKQHFNQGNSNHSTRSSTYRNRERKNTDQTDSPQRYLNRRGQNKNYSRGSYNNTRSSYGDSKPVECEISVWDEPEHNQQQTDRETSHKNLNDEYSSNLTQSNMNPKAVEFETKASNVLSTSDAPSEYDSETIDHSRRTSMRTCPSFRSTDDDYYSSKSTPNQRLNYSKPNYPERRSGDKRSNTCSNKIWFYEKRDREFQEIKEFIDCKKSVICHGKLKEKVGDLFEAPDTSSLAHCVAEDLSMGAGIAVCFRSKFGCVGFLQNQEQRTGGLAVLENNKRFIYYLITKERSHGKPTYYSLWLSLKKLKDHCVEHDVRQLAIPQIGCGLDRLNWDIVKQLLEHTFRDVDIEIVVYALDEFESSPRKPKKGFVTHTKLLLKDIEPFTGLLYLGTENAAKTDEIKSLDEKYKFIHAYTSAPKKVGDALKTIVDKEYIYGLIARKTIKDKFDFVALEKSLRELRKMLRDDWTEYIGFQAFEHAGSTLIVDKILSLMQYILIEVDIWVCWPPELEQYCPQSK